MFKTKHLHIQLAAVFLSVVFLIQMLGLVPMELTIDQHAKQSTAKQLQTGEGVFINQLQHDAKSLKQSGMLLANDPKLSAAIAGLDDSGLMTVMDDYQQSSHADIAYFISADNQKLIGNLSLNTQEQQVLKQRINAQKKGALQFIQLHKTPYLLVTAAVKAPEVIGWVVMGYKMDEHMASRLKTLSNLDISFVQKPLGNQWQTVASTLHPKQHNKLLNAIANTYTQNMGLETITLSDQVYQLKLRTLMQQNQDAALVAVLQSSVSDNIKPFDHLKYLVMGVIAVGLTMLAALLMYVARVMTLPMTELLDNVKEMARGNYIRRIKTSSKNELTELSQALDEMREAVSEREQKVHDLAYRDELTGLANRLLLMQALNKSVHQHEKTQSSLSVVVVNIDRFKQINTTFGRDFGDEVLCYVGKVLKSLLLSKDDVVARLDADEFVIVLHNSEQEKATAYASDVNAFFKTPVRIHEQLIDLRLVMGIALYPTHGDSEETLLHRAETAQQTAKQKKSDWIVYNSALEIDQSDKLVMMTELKEAIKHKQLMLYLQPKVNIKTKEVVGVEGLVRWIHPTKGLLLPEQFIPYVEQTATVSQITYWMIEEACSIMQRFKQQLIPINVSVNLTARDLNNLDLPNQIQKRLDAYGLKPQALRLEITENALMDDPKRTASVVNKLAELGIYISIDDFGSGYSSLAYLRELALNELKIDKSFVKQMDKNSNDKAIVRSTIDLGHNLGLKVVAEGIENEETVNLLASYGCDVGQGHYISKPMPVRDFGIWLERWNNQLNQIEYDLELKGSPLDIVANTYKPTLEMAIGQARPTTKANIDKISLEPIT